MTCASVPPLPSCVYGAICTMFRKVGVLNVPRSAPDLYPPDDVDGGLEPSVAAVGQRRLRPVAELDRPAGRQLISYRVVVGTSRAVLARVELVRPQPGVVEEQPDVAQQLLRMVHQHTRDHAGTRSDVAHRDQA